MLCASVFLRNISFVKNSLNSSRVKIVFGLRQKSSAVFLCVAWAWNTLRTGWNKMSIIHTGHSRQELHSDHILFGPFSHTAIKAFLRVIKEHKRMFPFFIPKMYNAIVVYVRYSSSVWPGGRSTDCHIHMAILKHGSRNFRWSRYLLKVTRIGWQVWMIRQ